MPARVVVLSRGEPLLHGKENAYLATLTNTLAVNNVVIVRGHEALRACSRRTTQ